MSHILFPAEIRPESRIGGKARALAALIEGELPIPEWFVVQPSAFKASAPPGFQDALARRESGAEAGETLPGIEVAHEVLTELEAALARIGNGTTLFAVRSSATDEDSASSSFAGQLESFLHVPRDQVALRLADVWKSGFSARLASYRRSRGAARMSEAPAVIVQRMVQGESSGVAFSADPVSARRTIAVVAAVPGLAVSLVGGEADADTWWVDREGQIVRHTARGRNGGPTRTNDGLGRDSGAAGAPVIDKQMVLRVADLARSAERHFGVPQDIEWTLGDGRLYLLQSRPITTLADRADPDGVPALWDNSNIIESYSGITTPLTFSFARRAYEHVYREFCRLIRVPEDVIESHSAMFCCMLGLIRGRIYYNLYNWYRLVAVLPGYRFNRRFMEQMMGVRESLPEDLAASQSGLSRVARLRDAWRLFMSTIAFLVHLITLNSRVRRFQDRLNEALGPTRPDLSGLRVEELAGYFRRLENRLLTHWDAPIVNDFATMVFHGLLRRLSGSWVGDQKGNLHNDLLCAEPGMISEEPARRVAAMAAMAAADNALTSVLQGGSALEAREALARHPALARLIQDYVDRFGDRCMEELKLESTTLHDDPALLYRAVGQHAATLAARGNVPLESRNAEIRRSATATMRAALAGQPLRRLLFTWVLNRARMCVRTRENLRFERTRVFGRARQIFIELGGRLTAVGCLDTPRDVFYLELDELLAFAEARASTTDLKGLVAVRKVEFTRYREMPEPAERFETRGLIYRGHSFTSTAAPAMMEGDSRQGLGCCPGVVRGAVRIVRDPRNVTVRRGEILVAEYTDPGWVMIFPSASGLLVERGSLLSHSAIVARELGLPAIVSLAGLTRWLKEGDWVEMDGSTGVVVKVEGADESRDAA
jgi:pyruvate,water dikinase